jgi:hypothetical protein
VRDGEVLTPPPKPDFEKAAAEAVERFRKVYREHGSPRIAVYWNRQLTDRLSQWVTTHRLVVTGSGSVAEEGTHGAWSRSRSGEAVVHGQRLERDPLRPGPDEPWGWAFQSGFLRPLMGAGVKVVDRAAILRITASGAGAKAVPVADDQVVEVSALQGFADLLVEILVSPSAQSPTSYEINATVKDVKDGVIMAYVNSRNLIQESVTREYVATNRGFELQERPPQLERVATNLALRVMNALAETWQVR